MEDQPIMADGERVALRTVNSFALKVHILTWWIVWNVVIHFLHYSRHNTYRS